MTDALEAQILANVDDPAAYLVYGDWLQAQGDPRGQLVATQAARLAQDSEALDAAEAALLAAHRDAFLGPLLAIEPEPRVEWFLGFWRALSIGQFGWSPQPAVLDHVAALLACDSARFLRELAVWGSISLDVIPLIARTARTLRSLELSFGLKVFDDASLLELRGCTELRKLHLFSCDRVTPAGLAALSELHALEEIDLRNHLFTDDSAACLAGLPLHTVKFNSVINLTERGMRHVAALPLVRLELGAEHLDDDAIAKLADHPTLARLDLRDADIDARGAAALGSIASLRRLYLKGATIDDAGVRSLGGLAALAALHLGPCAITDAACAALGGMTGLRFLDVSSTNVTGAGLRELARLPHLTTLDLSFLELDDDDVAPLIALSNLTSLGLAYSRRLTDRTIDLVCQLPALTTLDLGGASITPAGIDRLAQLPELRELGLTSCSDEVRAHAESFPHWYVNHRNCLEFDDEVY